MELGPWDVNAALAEALAKDADVLRDDNERSRYELGFRRAINWAWEREHAAWRQRMEQMKQEHGAPPTPRCGS